MLFNTLHIAVKRPLPPPRNDKRLAFQLRNLSLSHDLLGDLIFPLQDIWNRLINGIFPLYLYLYLFIRDVLISLHHMPCLFPNQTDQRRSQAWGNHS